MMRLEEWKTFQITKQNPEYRAEKEISQIGGKKTHQWVKRLYFLSTRFTKEMTLKSSVCDKKRVCWTVYWLLKTPF